MPKKNTEESLWVILGGNGTTTGTTSCIPEQVSDFMAAARKARPGTKFVQLTGGSFLLPGFDYYIRYQTEVCWHDENGNLCFDEVLYNQMLGMGNWGIKRLDWLDAIDAKIGEFTASNLTVGQYLQINLTDKNNKFWHSTIPVDFNPKESYDTCLKWYKRLKNYLRQYFTFTFFEWGRWDDKEVGEKWQFSQWGLSDGKKVKTLYLGIMPPGSDPLQALLRITELEGGKPAKIIVLAGLHDLFWTGANLGKIFPKAACGIYVPANAREFTVEAAIRQCQSLKIIRDEKEKGIDALWFLTE